MVIIFAHPKVRAYLLKHGMVYTFRKYHEKTVDGIRPQTGKDWITDKRCGKKIADVSITPMEPIDSLNMGRVLTKYIYYSGFATGFGFVDVNLSVRRWAKAINALNPDEPTKGWIYKVEIMEAEG